MAAVPAVGAGSCPLGRCMDLWPAPWAVHGPPPHVLPPPPTWEFWPCRQPVGQPSRHHPTYCHRRPRNSSGRAGSRSESGCVGAVSRRRRLPATHRHGPRPTHIARRRGATTPRIRCHRRPRGGSATVRVSRAARGSQRPQPLGGQLPEPGSRQPLGWQLGNPGCRQGPPAASTRSRPASG